MNLKQTGLYLIRVAVVLICMVLAITVILVGGERAPKATIALGLVLAVALMLRKKQLSKSSHGTAEWETYSGLRQRGMLNPKNEIVLCRTGGNLKPSFIESCEAFASAPPEKSEEVIQQLLAALGNGNPEGSLVKASLKDHPNQVVVSTTGGGKGVGLVLPNLLSDPNVDGPNVVCFDTKGENFTITADYRQKVLGHKIVRLDFAEQCGPGGSGFDPLYHLDPDDPGLADEARAIADAFIERTGREGDGAHFNESAVLWLTGFIVYVVAHAPRPELRNLQTVKTFLSSPDEQFNEHLRFMQQSLACEGMLSRMALQIGIPAERERSGIRSTLSRNLAFLDSPKVVTHVSNPATFFDPRELRNQKVTIYMIVPPRYLSSHAKLIRAYVSSFLRTLMTPEKKQRRTWFLLDEAASIIGQGLSSIEDALQMGRGMQINVAMIFQTEAQIEKGFAKKELVLSNCDLQMYFGISDLATATELSKRLGEYTLTVESTNENFSTSTSDNQQAAQTTSSWSSSYGSNRSEIARALLKPEEVLQLGKEDVIVLTRNSRPFLGKRISWYSDREFSTRGKQQEASQPKRYSGWWILLLLIPLLGWLNEQGLFKTWFHSPESVPVSSTQSPTSKPNEKE